MTKTSFSVDLRQTLGSKVARLRREGVIPGNVFGAQQDSMAIKLATGEFEKLYDQVGETGVVYLKIAGTDQEKPTMIDEVQRDPVSDQLLHVSFREVDLTEKVEAEVPVEIVGEFDVAGAVLVNVRNEIMVEALPTDIPEKFEIDVSTFEGVGEMITLGELKIDGQKVTLVEVETDEDLEKPVVLVQEQREEEVEEEPVVEEVEGEVGAEAETEGKPESAEAEQQSTDEATAD